MSIDDSCLSSVRHLVPSCLLKRASAWLLAALLLTQGASMAQQTDVARRSPVPLFVASSAAMADPADVPSGASSLVQLRSRALTVDRSALAELVRQPKTTERRAANGEATVLLNLFPDTALPFHLREVRPTHDGIGMQWFGTVDEGSGQSSGDSILTWYRGAMVGFVRLNGGEYYRITLPAFGAGEVRQLKFLGYPGGPVDYVVPAEQSAEPGEGERAAEGKTEAVAESANFLNAGNGWLFDSPRESGNNSVIDVMLVFTANAGGGGDESFRNALANNIVSEANAIFSGSDTSIELRLVHAPVVNWNDSEVYASQNYLDALEAIGSNGDGRLDEIHALRDLYGADLVSLIVTPPIPGGLFVVGMANLLRNNPESFGASAFSVVHRNYAGGPSYTFAHEIGHNLGLVHDDANGGTGGGLQPYSKGYQQKTFAPTFFTVMAYSFGCDGCQAAPNFSNPNINYQSIPMGIPNQIDAARTLRFVKGFAAAWRAAAPPPNCTYSLSVTSPLEVSGAAHSQTISVRTSIGCAWAATSNATWASFASPAGGTGDGSATLELADNPLLDKRTANLVVAGTTLVLEQSPKLCFASVPSLSLGSAATVAEAQLTLANPCRFEVQSQVAWISPVDGVQQSSTQTTAKVKLAVSENSTGAARTGRVTIANYTFEVLQSAVAQVCAYSLPATPLQVPANGGTFSVALQTDPGCPWSASYSGNVNFLQRVHSGSGSTVIPLTIGSNSSSSTLTGTVGIEGKLFTVVQAGRASACAFTIAPASFEVPFNGGRISFRVSTAEDCAWNLMFPTEWIRSVTSTSGYGSLDVVLNVDTNASAFPRTGTLRAGTASATVVQAGVPPPVNCSYIVTPANLDFPFSESTRQVTVETTSACPWVVEANQTWLVSSITGGSGPATVQLRAAANTSAVPRSGAVLIGGKSIAITQAGSPAAQTLSPFPQVVVLNMDLSSNEPAKAQISVTAGGADLPIRLGPLQSIWIRESVPATTTLKPFEVAASRGTLEPGLHETMLTVSSVGTSLPSAKIPVLFNMPAFQFAHITPRSLSFRAVSGSNPQPQSIRLRRLLRAPTVKAVTGGVNWLSVKMVPHEGGDRVDATVASALLPVGIYDGAITIDCGAGCGAIALPVRLVVEANEAAPGPLPRVASGGTVNGASFEQGITSGAWMSVFGTNLAPGSRLWALSDFDGDRFPLQLDGVRVTVAGKPAPVNFISPGQINFQAPSGLPDGWVPVEVETPAGKHTVFAFAARQAPGIFMFDAQRQVAALHPDGTPARKPRSAAEPGRVAKPGDILAVYGTGFGPTDPDVPAGRIFSGAAPLARFYTPAVIVGGVQTRAQFAGLSGAGLYQVNFEVPALTSGSYEVDMNFNGVSVQLGLVLHVEP